MVTDRFKSTNPSKEAVRSVQGIHNSEADLTLKWFKFTLAVFVLLALFALSGNLVFIALEIFAGVFAVLLYIHLKTVEILSEMLVVALWVGEQDEQDED